MHSKELRWAQLWQQALGTDYLPRVHLRGIARIGYSEGEQVQQTKRKRLFSTGGLLKLLLQQGGYEPQDDDSECEPPLFGQWNAALSTYMSPSV